MLKSNGDADWNQHNLFFDGLDYVLNVYMYIYIYNIYIHIYRIY